MLHFSEFFLKHSLCSFKRVSNFFAIAGSEFAITIIVHFIYRECSQSYPSKDNNRVFIWPSYLRVPVDTSNNWLTHLCVCKITNCSCNLRSLKCFSHILLEITDVTALGSTSVMINLLLTLIYSLNGCVFLSLS